MLRLCTVLLLFIALSLTSVAQPLMAAQAIKGQSPIVATVGYLLKRFYYDHDRFHPELMIKHAIRALETTEMSLEISWDGAEIRCHFNAAIHTIPAPKPTTMIQAMGILMQLQQLIENADVYDSEAIADMTYAMVNGALQTLDPHTVVFPPRQASRFTSDIAGHFYGIGAYLDHSDGIVAIDRTMPGRPADKAGVRGGDKIMRVDGEKTEGLSLSETVERIKGPRGTKVVLGIERAGHAELLSIEVTRDLVNVPILQSYRTGDIAYLRFDEFNANADVMLRKVLTAWENDAEHPVYGLVLDMRANGGGLLDKARLISDMFLGAGKETVRTVAKDELPSKFYSNSNGLSILDVPMIVLMSSSSASAAEIVAGALQQHNRAVIVGSTSYGKGSVQTTRMLQDKSLFKFTIQEYQLKDGVSIQGVGIVPDVELQRHSLNKDGEIDVRPYVGRHEADAEFSLAAHHTYTHTTAYYLPWLAEYEDEDTRRSHYISAESFHPDQEAMLAIELLTAAVHSPQIDAIMDGVTLDDYATATIALLREPVAQRAEQEAKDLAAALAEKTDMVSWGSAQPIALDSLHIEYTGVTTLQAGQAYDMEFKIHNSSSVDCGRVYAVVRRNAKDMASPFWEDEIIFGNIPAQGSTLGSFSFAVPPRLYSNAEHLTIDVYQNGVAAVLLSTDVNIELVGSKRPHFQVSWKLKGTPAAMAFDTPQQMELTIRNDGDVTSAPVKVVVSKDDNRFIQLSQARWELEALHPNQSQVIVIPFQIQKDVKLLTRTVANLEKDFHLNVFIEERFTEAGMNQYRESFAHEIQMSVGQLAHGAVLRSPRFDGVVWRTDDTHMHIELHVSDDNLEFVTIFHGREKIALYTADMLTDGLLTTDILLNEGLNHVQIIARDADKLLTSLPIRHWVAVTETAAHTVETAHTVAPQDIIVP